MTDTRNGALSEQVAGADLDPRAKGFMEMLEKDENVPPELLEKLRGAGSDLIRRLFSDEDTDEEKVKQADAYYEGIKTSVYKGYKQDKIEMRGDRAEMSDFPLYLNTVAGGLDRRDQTIGGFSFVVKIYAVPVVEIIG